MSDRLKAVLWPLGFGALFLAVWQLGGFHAALGLMPFQLPLPSEIADALIRIAAKTSNDAIVTLSGALAGLILGSALGFGVALVAALFPRWGYGSLIVVSALNAVPVVALSPIMNRWFSDGMSQKIGVVTVVTMAAMAINAYRGLTDLKPFSLDLMQSYAAKRSTVLFHLRLPNALPSIFTALKINVTTALISAIVSEYFASSTSGLGFGIKDNLRKAEMAMGWAYITVASVAGILLYLLIVWAEKRFTKWHPSQINQKADAGLGPAR
jgi:NitT/TauT family transport system permease protein